ncbi:ArdC family protein [Vibrio sp. WXL103]|uniref:ArdC family protein n=1 Tax=Vibrio sp. WXL103 TaxID=3450710 RepID=UPI003EC5852E
MATNTNTKTDFYQEITNAVIEALKAGVKPWKCPWDRTNASGLPVNASTHNHYNGMNIMLLWMSAAMRGFSSEFWLTFKQAKALKGQVRKGEKGTKIFYYQMVEKKGATDEKDVYPMLKTYTVFNLDQVDGIDFDSSTTEQPRTILQDEEIERFIADTHADIVYGGQKAFYRPSTDSIVLPARERFHSQADMYATAMHELVHWTGHKSRLERDLKGQFGTKDYAFEELIAELGACFLMADLGLSGDVQHESYIANWLQALENDKRYIFKAAAFASKAHQYLVETVNHDSESIAA